MGSGFDWDIKHPRSKDGRFELRYSRRDKDSYMDSETDEDWTLVDLANNRTVKEWWGSSTSDSRGTRTSGADAVKFSEDDEAVVVENYDGTTERFELQR